jgi:hypothetical protein
MPPLYFFLIDVSIFVVRSDVIEVRTSLLIQCVACTEYPYFIVGKCMATSSCE